MPRSAASEASDPSGAGWGNNGSRIAAGDGNGVGITLKRCNTDPTGYIMPEVEVAEDYYEWQGTGWEDETSVMVKGVNPFFGQDLVRAKKAHRFTPAEELKMAKFESLDYWEPNTKIFRDNVEAMKKLRRSMKWAIYLLIGFCVGLCAFALTNTIEWLSSRRLAWFRQALEHGSGTGYVVLITLSVVGIAAGTGLCAVWPHAAGSGVPDVMAYLNGVAFPKVFNISTFFGKLLSCALAVSSGLPVGPEGPLIHMGALIGAGVGTGRSKSLNFGLDCFDRFRTSKDHRDFITGGAAAGVACAFSAPIGGLLFVIEEISSFFSHKAMWMAFFASLMAIIVENTLNTHLEGWSARPMLETNCTAAASWRAEYTVLFKANALPDVNLLSMLLGIFLGIFCGMFGAAFTFFNIKISRFRMNVLNKSTVRRMAEPILIVALYVSLTFILVQTTPCERKPGVLLEHKNRSIDPSLADIDLFTSVCNDPEKEYHPLGTLFFTSADDCVRLLFRRRDDTRVYDTLKFQRELFPPQTLAIFCIVYMIFACWSAGTFLSCGLVIPMMVIGSSIGRLYGHLVIEILHATEGEACTLSDMWVDPGIFALLGAAGFFAGVSRLTFSLCVIMLEITGDLPHLPNIMICVMAAKMVADSFTHPLYHALLELKCVPFLDFDMHLPYLDCYTARDLIRSNGKLVTLPTGVTVEDLVCVLLDNPHNAYPVVAGDKVLQGAGTLKGTVLRSQLEQVLWLLHDALLDGEAATLDHENMGRIRERIYWRRLRSIPFRDGVPPELAGKVIDLTPIANTSVFSVPETFSVSATYTLFRGMGLRHLVVVNRYNSVVGMITRKDLIAHTILKHTIESSVDGNDDPLPSDLTEWKQNGAHPEHDHFFKGLERQSSSRGFSALQRAIRSTSPGECGSFSDSCDPRSPTAPYKRSPGSKPSAPRTFSRGVAGVARTPTARAFNGSSRRNPSQLTLDRESEKDGLLAQGGYTMYGADSRAGKSSVRSLPRGTAVDGGSVPSSTLAPPGVSPVADHSRGPRSLSWPPGSLESPTKQRQQSQGGASASAHAASHASGAQVLHTVVSPKGANDHLSPPPRR